MMTADEFDDWCAYNSIYPLDDQSNFHVPIASLQATYVNANLKENASPISIGDCLVFGVKKDKHIDELLLNEDW